MKKTRSATGYNVQSSSKHLTCILSYTVDVCDLFCHYSIFFSYPKCPGLYHWWRKIACRSHRNKLSLQFLKKIMFNVTDV